MYSLKEMEDLLNSYTENYICVKNINLFNIALVQKSLGKVNNERLEFLGDAFYNAIVVEYLFERFKNEDEGFLTKLKIQLVNKKNLVYFAKKLNFKLIHDDNIDISDRFYEDSFEAIIGALIKDNNGNINYTRIFIYSLLDNLVDFNDIIINDRNYKDILLRTFQKYKLQNPEYTVLDSKLAKKQTYYKSAVYISEKDLHLLKNNGFDLEYKRDTNDNGDIKYFLDSGEGNNKKIAEQNCSCNILKKMGLI